MFADASAIVAIISKEPGWEEIAKRIGEHGEVSISPLVRFEAVQALARKGAGTRLKPDAALLEQAAAAVDAFVVDLGIQEISITPDVGLTALSASMRYGKAVGHPADLNFGDCFAYACAKALGVPLAYKGNDFALTDMA